MPMNRYLKSRKSSKHKRALSKQTSLEIGRPFEFKLVTHVELDKKTNRLVGLPPEWMKILEKDFQIEIPKKKPLEKYKIIYFY